MSKKGIRYRQCQYRSATEEGELVSVAWLPERFAVVGQKIYFGKKTEEPDRVWTVVSVSDKSMPEEYVLAHERDYKNQRAASDI